MKSEILLKLCSGQEYTCDFGENRVLIKTEMLTTDNFGSFFFLSVQVRLSNAFKYASPVGGCVGSCVVSQLQLQSSSTTATFWCQKYCTKGTAGCRIAVVKAISNNMTYSLFFTNCNIFEAKVRKNKIHKSIFFEKIDSDILKYEISFFTFVGIGMTNKSLL